MTGKIMDDGIPELFPIREIKSQSIENDLTIETDGKTAGIWLNRDGVIIALDFGESVELALGILECLDISREDFNADLRKNKIRIV